MQSRKVKNCSNIIVKGMGAARGDGQELEHQSSNNTSPVQRSAVCYEAKPGKQAKLSSLRQILTIDDRTVLNPILHYYFITHLYITLRCSFLFYSAQLAKTVKLTRFRKISSSIDSNDERSL